MDYTFTGIGLLIAALAVFCFGTTISAGVIIIIILLVKLIGSIGEKFYDKRRNVTKKR